MAQGEAHLPAGHSKVTMPLGCLVGGAGPPPSPAVGHLPAARTHFLCLSGAEVQGPRA